jgi:Putative peptidoglycan binding domain/L,D-transpeptidase catalytic domain
MGGRTLLLGGATAVVVAGTAAAMPRAGAGAAVVPNVQARTVTAQSTLLHLGSRGPRVRTLQQRLVNLGYLPTGAADGVFGMRTWHAVVAFQGWQWIQRDGVVGARTRAALASATRPRPWVPLRRGLELDLRRQVLLVIAGGRTLRAVHISSARPGYVTPRGRFRVYRRERLSWSVPFEVWMPYALYFNGGYAIHAFGVVPAYPASHGCIRMPLGEAPFVYAATPLRAPVVIR